MKTGIEIIAAERAEQIEKHGYTLDHDLATYDMGELADAAILLLSCEEHGYPKNFPSAFIAKIIRKPFRERLAIAGAWLAAELDRKPKQNIS